MLYQVKSSKSLDEIERDLKGSAARHQFGVIAMHDQYMVTDGAFPRFSSYVKTFSALRLRQRTCCVTSIF